MFEAHPERLSCNQQTSLVNGVPGTGGGCGVGVTGTDLWASFADSPGSCNHDPAAALAEARRRLVSPAYPWQTVFGYYVPHFHVCVPQSLTGGVFSDWLELD